jgi:hypothetical protein
MFGSALPLHEKKKASPLAYLSYLALNVYEPSILVHDEPPETDTAYTLFFASVGLAAVVVAGAVVTEDSGMIGVVAPNGVGVVTTNGVGVGVVASNGAASDTINVKVAPAQPLKTGDQPVVGGLIPHVPPQ